MTQGPCSLCLKSNAANFDIELYRLPASQKTIAAVLQHLGNCIKTKLLFQSGASVCLECFNELSEYDNLMLNLLSFQRKLSQQLKDMIAFKFRSEEHEEIIDVAMEIEEELQVTDAFNPEFDAKEELIEVESFEDKTGDSSEDGDNSNSTENNRRRSNNECLNCEKIFSSKAQLQLHISEVHNSKAYTCKLCGAVRRDEEYLELHMNIHEGKTENECRFCPKKFSRRVNTLRHMRKHWDKKKYQCEKCGERFSLDNMLYNHRLRHEAEENPLICSICNQSFKSRKTYNHHILIHQENRPRHHCTLCSKSFTERYTLKMHMKTHAESEPPLLPSSMQEIEEECKEIEEAVITLVEEFSCVICNTKFDNKDLLEEHLQQDHDVILK